MNYRSKYFDYSIDFKSLNFRENPSLYEIGRGKQGVILVEPYKSEILLYWKFKNIEAATKSSCKIYNLFLDYKLKNDFIDMDMARKFLQMGFTRAKRYANHTSGKKFIANPQKAVSKSVEKQLRQKAGKPTASVVG